MKVQLMFRCHYKGESLGTMRNEATGVYEPTKLGNAKLSAVTGYEAEHSKAPALQEQIKAFFAATPSGNLEFGTINQEASELFEPGALYRITLERVP